MGGILFLILGVVVLAVFLFWILGQKRINELEAELKMKQKEIDDLTKFRK